jgi:hypothetical protein
MQVLLTSVYCTSVIEIFSLKTVALGRQVFNLSANNFVPSTVPDSNTADFTAVTGNMFPLVLISVL